MKRVVQSLVTFLVLIGAMAGVARAADVSQAVILVATPRLEGSPFEEAVVLAAPLPQGGHIGFIVNRPTTVKLERLFPQEAQSRNVAEPVYLGGPVLPNGLFALTRAAPEDGATQVPIVPGLVAVLDGPTIDHII